MEQKIKIIDKRIFATYIIVIIVLLFGVTYALIRTSVAIRATATSLTVAYQSEFSNSNINFVPILDENVEEDGNNVIKIDFEVGGTEENPKDIELIYDITLINLDIDEELKNQYLKWKLIKNGEELANGDFENIKDLTELTLTGIQENLPKPTEAKDKCTFYLWLSDSCQYNDISKCKGFLDQKDMLKKKVSGNLEVRLNTGYKVPKNIELYFNPNGGEVAETSKTVVYNGILTNLPTPIREGYTFIGWYSNRYKDNPLDYYANTYPELYEKYNYDNDKLYNDYITEGKENNKRIAEFIENDPVKITTDKTLYAGWIKN